MGILPISSLGQLPQTGKLKTPVSVSGTLVTSTGEPIKAGIITLERTDSSLVKATISDSAGYFILVALASGQYRLRITHIGFETAYQAIHLSDSLATPLLRIELRPTVINLQEVSVKQKKPPFELAADRITLNIESNPMFAGQSVIDALSVAPRITVDPVAKSVSIDGKSGFILYQNNRQLYMPADQVIPYLRSLNTNAIARIDVLTNPPASYDAGASGVILLYTKRMSKEGFMGELSLASGAGRFLKANASLNLSFRMGNVQGTFLYAPNYRPTYYSYHSQQKLTGLTPTAAGYSQSEEFNHTANTSHILRTGWDWRVQKKTTLGAVLQATYSSETNNPESSLMYKLPVDTAKVSRINAVTQLKQQITNLAGNVNFRREFNSPQTNLSVDLDYAYYNNRAVSSAEFVLKRSDQPDRSESLRVRYPNFVYIRTAKADFTTPITKKTQLEAGIKYSLISMDNTPTAERYTAYFARLEPLLVKPYQYQERTGSAYSNVNFSDEKWSFQAGLRIEKTLYSGRSNATTTISRNYTNLFPSINVQYIAGNKSRYSLAANQRILRPSFDQLNPAYNFYDPLTLYSGNPLLLPQLTTTVQASYATPEQISLTVVYSHTRNRIIEAIYRLDTLSATTLDYNINFDWEKRLSATVSIPAQPTPWWQLQATVTAAHAQFYTTFKDLPTFNSQSSVVIRMTNTVKGKIWSANLNLTYRSRSLAGYFYYDPLWYIDIGIQRPVGPQGAIKLSATDLFHTWLISNMGNYGITHIAYQHRFESQRLLLTYTYRFGNRKGKSIENRKFGSDTEQQRLGDNN